MQGTRMVKAIYCWKPISRRPIRRPKTRWVDDVRKDIQKLKVPNWKTVAQGRRRWKVLVEKAKTLHKELYSRLRRRRLRPIFLRYTFDISAMLLLVWRLVVFFLGLRVCCQKPAFYIEVSDYRFISRHL
jgi:hypothetical protein